MLKRMILWLFFGLLLSTFPLGIVILIRWMPNSGIDGVFELLSDGEPLAVAFTLSGAAAADVLVNNASASLMPLKLFVGGATFIMTLVAIAAYILIKTNSTFLTHDQIIESVVYCFAGTIAGSFFSELLTEL